MPINRTARQFWTETPVRGEALPGARYELLRISRIAFHRDWADAAMVVALQKHQQSVLKALAHISEVNRGMIFLSEVSPDLVGISYVTSDGKRANIFCSPPELETLIVEIGLDRDRAVYCEHYT